MVAGLLIRQLDDETWQAFFEGELLDTDLDDDELAEVVFDLLSDGDLDPEEKVIIDDSHGLRASRAYRLISPEQQRELGYVISAQPYAGRPQD